jgi:hypothetical protein
MPNPPRLTNAEKIIVDLCSGTGAWSKPYREAGYDVRLITLPDYDVRTYTPPPNVYGILAAPPCTEFSVVKNEKLPRDIEAGMRIVDACTRIILMSDPVFWALENPAGRLANCLGAPKFVFQPWQFGDAWTKRTYIWGRFNAPVATCERYEDASALPLYKRPGRDKVNLVWLHRSAIKNIPQLAGFEPKSDAAFRAITPPGFARAFFEANR